MTVAAEIRRLKKKGCSQNMAEILAYRRPPGVHGTDSVAFAGVSLERDHGRDAKRIYEAAQKHGYTPNPNDMYNPTFARFEGDPQAFASQGQGLSHFVKLAEQRGTGVQGDINIPARQRDPSQVKRKKLAKRIVDKHLQAAYAANPELKFAKDKGELVNQIEQKHGLGRK